MVDFGTSQLRLYCLLSIFIIFLTVFKVHIALAESTFREDTSLATVYQLISEQDLTAAIEVLDELLEEDDLEETLIIHALRLRGSIWLRDRNYDKAVADFSSALRLGGDDIWLLWQRCWAHSQRGRFVPARPDCDRALALAKRQLNDAAASETPGESLRLARLDLRSAVVASAELLKQIGEPNRALALLRDYLSSDDFDRDQSILSLLSKLSLMTGDVSAAEHYIEEALASSEGRAMMVNSDLLSQRAEILYLTGRFKQAAIDFSEAHRLTKEADRLTLEDDEDDDKGDPELLYRACAALLNAGEAQSAIEPCARFYKSDSSQPPAIDAYGMALWRVGDLAAARDVYEDGLGQHPDNPYLRIHLSRVLSQMGSVEQAEEVLDGVHLEYLKLFMLEKE